MLWSYPYFTGTFFQDDSRNDLTSDVSFSSNALHSCNHMDMVYTHQSHDSTYRTLYFHHFSGVKVVWTVNMRFAYAFFFNFLLAESEYTW
jgi:hypothetical protein